MTSRFKYLAIGGGVVVVLAIAAVVGVWWFLRDDAPDEVSLESAVDAVGADSADGTTDGEPTDDADGGVATGGSSFDGDIAGTWTVDTESGDFDYESATGTFVGFRIEEELSSIGSTTAVGRTGDVTGSMTIEGTTLTAANFEVDMTTITTNESRRDDNVYRALDTDQFPTGSFVLTEPVDLGADAADGGAVSITAVGDLTLHGVTKAVEFPLEAELVDGTIVVVGSLDIVFADYDVEVPTAPIVVSVEDHGPIELQLLLTES
ncbi:MAG: YceI family protein [Actinomycetota bacterium]|nr:YceI family protein [Actinomycetota bacterium]